MAGWAQPTSPLDSLHHLRKKSLTTETQLAVFQALADYHQRRRPDSAQWYAQQALKLAQDQHAGLAEVQALHLLSETTYRQGDYSGSSQFYLALLQRTKVREDSLLMAVAYHGLGNIDWRFGNYPQALQHYLMGLSIRNQLNDSLGMADSHYSIGIIQAELFAYDRARNEYQEALKIARKKNDKQRMANILNVIGRSWRKQNIFDKALIAHEESFRLYQELADQMGISDYYNNMGSIYRRQGKYEEALQYFFSGLDIQTDLGDQEGIADAYNDIGTTYTQQGSYERGIRFLLKGLEIAQATGLKDDIRYAYASLSVAYDSLGQDQLALNYYRLSTEMKDSLLNRNKQEQLNQLQVEHQLETKTRQIELLQKEKELFQSQQEVRSANTRQAFILLGASLVLLLSFGGFMIWRSRLQSRLNRKLATKNRTIELERKKSEGLLHNILPVSVAEELKNSSTNQVKARRHEQVSVLFTDFKGFSQIAVKMSPEDLVDALGECFKAFDEIILRHGLEKIKTIGDAYMCAGGLPDPSSDHAEKVVRAALEMQAYMAQHKQVRKAAGKVFFEARLGIHSGPVVAGVVGIQKFAYDIWGDTVNTASRMESKGKVGRVNISQATFKLIEEQFMCEYRGKVAVKHGVEIDMYFVNWAI